ncbi:hypothetical protein KSC_057970 [Ktedonobacter sp. SOSP1-52]|uniref:hypothetical protein n=1 Tax=Ktedonobacter sp. SOSP1-52 TaxID=2778366 RepID=UPI001916C50C|nr:hypothetical protein [Ktedonobacter sp. SOSP1-52]GHO66905.1 hypothetical protein KSC_057970 [Ktedonobacter sp. SOSP1-52]
MQNHGSSDAVTNYPAVAEPLETSVQQHLERVSGATDTLLTLFWLGQILSGLGNAFAIS